MERRMTTEHFDVGALLTNGQFDEDLGNFLISLGFSMEYNHLMGFAVFTI
jgi:hypothetical protein